MNKLINSSSHSRSNATPNTPFLEKVFEPEENVDIIHFFPYEKPPEKRCRMEEEFEREYAGKWVEKIRQCFKKISSAHKNYIQSLKDFHINEHEDVECKKWEYEMLVSDTWCKLTYEIENEKTEFIINSEAAEPEKDENDNQKVILVSDEDGTRIEFNRVEGLKTMFLKKKNANLLVERFDSGFYEDLYLLLNEMYELVLTTVDEKLNEAKSGWGNYRDLQTKIRKLSNLCRQSTDQKPI